MGKKIKENFFPTGSREDRFQRERHLISTSKFIQRLTKLHEPVGRVQLVVFEKFSSAYLLQIAREKSCDYVVIIYMKKYEIAYNDNAKINFIQTPLVILCFRLKQPRRMKTVIYKDIFRSLRRKKFQSRAKQLFSLVCYFFALN